MCSRYPLHPNSLSLLMIDAVFAHTDYARGLLDSLSAWPALGFGTSLGELIGLDLLRHGLQANKTVIVCEPPAISLLTSTEQASFAELRKEVEEIALCEWTRTTFRRFLMAMV